MSNEFFNDFDIEHLSMVTTHIGTFLGVWDGEVMQDPIMVQVVPGKTTANIQFVPVMPPTKVISIYNPITSVRLADIEPKHGEQLRDNYEKFIIQQRSGIVLAPGQA
jgi:hypothetical protein